MATRMSFRLRIKCFQPVNIHFSRLVHSNIDSYESRRVVVTGLGTVTPLGTNTNLAFENLLKKQSCTKHITEEMNEEDKKFGDIYSRLSSQVAARVPLTEFNEKKKDCIKSSDLRSMSRAMSMGIVASVEALKDSNWNAKDPNLLARTGVAIGNAMVDLDYISESHSLLTGSTKGNKVNPFFVPKILPNLCAGHVSILNGFQGPCHSVSTACATGSHAIGDAFNFIKTGAADVMVSGGCDACINPLSVAAFCRARALSTKYNDNPSKASRPFDTNRDGFVMGEGSGVLILEELKHAINRNANIYCELLGYGLSGDAHHITSGRDDGEGALLAINGAFKSLMNANKNLNASKKAGTEENVLWCVNAHSTSTPKGDAAEMKAINKFISNFDVNMFPNTKLNSNGVHVTSHKGNFGHLMGAAGSVESSFVALSLAKRILPPTINLDMPDDGMEVDGKSKIVRDVVDASKETSQTRKLILKNSFGFGGTNVSLLFGEFRE
jgi:3-oxoacyl-[acyl-carrier-protein] synthase II